MASLKTGGSGFSLSIRTTIFFLVTVSLFDSGFGCWGGGSLEKVDKSSFHKEYRRKFKNCKTPFFQTLLSNPTKAAQELVRSGKILLEKAYPDRVPKNLQGVVSVEEEIELNYKESERERGKELRPKLEEWRAKYKFKDPDELDKFEEKKSCIDGHDVELFPGFRKRCDKTWNHAKVNKIISSHFGSRCTKGVCHFHHKKLDFVCRSTCPRAIILLVVTAILFVGLHSMQYIA